jgi:serine O-acetyltransferase
VLARCARQWWPPASARRSRELDDAFVAARFEAHRACPGCPSPHDVAAWLDDVLGFVFPELATRRFDDLDDVPRLRRRAGERLVGLVHDCPDATAFAATVADGFLAGLAALHARLEEDADAIVAGDPAAWSRSEVIRSYPGFYAIAAHRVAHALLAQGARMLARMIAAHAHRSTGIDIHPAARIGHRCCIDHGTGLVIGETAELGDDVKLYQGVTLGGLSVRKEDAEHQAPSDDRRPGGDLRRAPPSSAATPWWATTASSAATSGSRARCRRSPSSPTGRRSRSR